MKNVAQNFFYQALFRVVKIIMPIITIPIVSKALGPEGIGTYNYTNSIAQYFVLLAGLGVITYGNREIAMAWNKKQNISRLFWEIFLFKAICAIGILLGYFFVVSFFDNKIFFYAQSLIIIAVLFDVSWFFMGIEDFKKISLANLIVQLSTFVLIVFLVEDANDVLLYTVIQTAGILLSHTLVWIFLKEHVSFVKVSIKEAMSHFSGSVNFFIPQVSILLYTNLNKTLLGFFIGNVAVGYFSNSLQLNTVFITVITTLDVVLLPHMSGLFAKNNHSEIIRTMEKTIHLQLFFSIPIAFGMLTVYDKLVPWFFGPDFLFINKVIPWFTILIIIMPLGMAISRQYLMPIGRIKEYNKSVMIGAIINVFSNLVLLPTIGFFGVVISNILAELFVTITRTKSFLKDTNFKFKLKKINIYVFSGLVMCIITRLLTHNMGPSLLTNIIQVTIAVPIYLVLTSLSKENPLLEFIQKKITE